MLATALVQIISIIYIEGGPHRQPREKAIERQEGKLPEVEFGPGAGVVMFVHGPPPQRLKLFCDVSDSACPDHIDHIYKEGLTVTGSQEKRQ